MIEHAGQPVRTEKTRTVAALIAYPNLGRASAMKRFSVRDWLPKPSSKYLSFHESAVNLSSNRRWPNYQARTGRRVEVGLQVCSAPGKTYLVRLAERVAGRFRL